MHPAVQELHWCFVAIACRWCPCTTRPMQRIFSSGPTPSASEPPEALQVASKPLPGLHPCPPLVCRDPRSLLLQSQPASCLWRSPLLLRRARPATCGQPCTRQPAEKAPLMVPFPLSSLRCCLPPSLTFCSLLPALFPLRSGAPHSTEGPPFPPTLFSTPSPPLSPPFLHLSLHPFSTLFSSPFFAGLTRAT